MQPDGKVLLGGNFLLLNQGRPQFGLVRLQPDGELNPTFRNVSQLTADLSLSAVAFTSDGRTWISGAFFDVDHGSRQQLARLNADGSLDPDLSPGTGPASLPRCHSDPRGPSCSTRASPSPDDRTGGITLPAFGSPLPDSELTGDYTVTVGSLFGGSAAEHFFIRRMPSAPYFFLQPAPVQTNVGRPIALFTNVRSSAALAYQWFKNGVALPGATKLSYSVAQASLNDSGDYTPVARNALGIASSDTVPVGVDETARFVNLATRGNVGDDDASLIVGFIVQGSDRKRVMLRAVGPTLGRAPFNVPGTLADPVLRVYNSAGDVIYTNDDWAAAPEVSSLATAAPPFGAFQLASGSTDAAGILTLNPGPYSAVITGKSVNGVASTGVTLAEIYEDDATSNRLVNLASRGFVSPGASVMIPAFVTVNPTNQAPEKLLIRGIGPGLTAFGVTTALADPTLSVVDRTDRTDRTVATNDNWETNPNGADLRAATALLACPLAAGSKDSALRISLPPGA